jgi:F-type H+-transporting ATPase subunit epsilon
MADSLQLRVYTPEQQLVDAVVREVTAPGVWGEIGILPDHAALVTTLEAGVLSYKSTTGGAERFQIGGGVAEVRDNVVTVLADSGERLPA